MVGDVYGTLPKVLFVKFVFLFKADDTDDDEPVTPKCKKKATSKVTPKSSQKVGLWSCMNSAKVIDWIIGLPIVLDQPIKRLFR